MAHKTLIGGTAYEIDGGKTLIGGTVYEIDKGKTLVGGTGYNVMFSRNISVVQSSGGTMAVSHTSALAGTTITITPTPNGGRWYESCVLYWVENGVQKTQALSMAQRTFIMPDADVTIRNIIFRQVYIIRIMGGSTNGEDPIFTFPPNVSWEWIANSEYNTDIVNPNRKRLWIDYNGESWRDVRMGSSGYLCKNGYYDGYQVRSNFISTNGETYYCSGG